MIDLVGEYRALMRRTPITAAKQLHRQYGVPWKAIIAAVPAPARVRFADRARALFEPDEVRLAKYAQLDADLLRAVGAGPVPRRADSRRAEGRR